MKNSMNRLTEIMSTAEGFCLWTATTLAGFLSGYEGMLALITFSTIIDALWGVSNAVHFNKFILSDLLMSTISKMLSYLSIFAVVMMIEKTVGFDTTFCSSIVVGAIALTEVWSISGHILIRFPRLLFFRLLKPALKGEIARKLGIGVEEVSEILDSQNKSKKICRNKRTDSKE